MVRGKIVIVIVIVTAVGFASLLLAERQDRKAVRDFFATPQKYDMTNGQEMRPRW